MLAPNRGSFKTLKIRTFLPMLTVWAIVVSFNMSNGMISPFLSIYATQSLQQSVVYVGLLFAAYSVTSFLVRIPGAFLADRYGTRILIVIGVILNVIGYSIFVLAKDPGILLIARALQGSAISVFQPSMLSYITRMRIPGATNRQVVSYSSTGFPVGGSTGNAVGGLVLALGFAVLFLTAAALTYFVLTLAAVVLWFYSSPSTTVIDLAKEPSPAGRRDESETVTKPPSPAKLLSRAMILLLITRLLLSYDIGTQQAFLPLYASNVLSFGTVEIGILQSTQSLLAIAGRPVSNFLTAQFGDKTALRVSTLCMTSSFVIMTFAPTKELVWIVMPLVGMSVGIFQPSSIMQVANMVPLERRTTGLGLLTMMLDGGTAVGASAAAFILLFGGYFWVFGVALCLAATALTLQLKYE